MPQWKKLEKVGASKYLALLLKQVKGLWDYTFKKIKLALNL